FHELGKFRRVAFDGVFKSSREQAREGSLFTSSAESSKESDEDGAKRVRGPVDDVVLQEASADGKGADTQLDRSLVTADRPVASRRVYENARRRWHSSKCLQSRDHIRVGRFAKRILHWVVVGSGGQLSQEGKTSCRQLFEPPSDL